MRLIDLVNGMTVYLYGNDIEKWEKICKDAKEGKIPTITLRGIEYALVRHGKWIEINTYEPRFGEYVDKVKCSECGCVEYFNKGWARFKYCPVCGCKMDLDEVNDE